MKYVSTRGGMERRPFTEILLEGLAPDGGLVVPESIPRLSPEELNALRGLPYPDLAIEIIGRFVDDIPPADLESIIRATYTTDVFGSAEITPVSPLFENLHLLQLSNGPSLAFKDVAMQFLGHLFAYVLGKTGEELNILGATSGDTGGAAIEAMRSKPRIRVFMLSPLGRTSEFQAAQMFSVLDDNIHNIAIRGVFDDCQDIVKVVGEDAAFKAKYRIGTVNSINWARIVAQVVYYFAGYFATTTENTQKVSFAVPSGNFGNIYAGHIARTMGLPIGRLVLATNENDVLHEFVRTGAYRVRPSANVHATSSPSMDISKASNFERFIYDLTGHDAAETRRLFDLVSTQGGFDLGGTDLHRSLADYAFVSGSSSHADRLRTIQLVYTQTGRVIDTHTADGVSVALSAKGAGVDGPILCAETALPAKFADAIREALHVEPPRPASLADLETRPRRVVELDADAALVMQEVARVVGG
jgi:threonine synthase